MTPQELELEQKAGRRAAWFWGSLVVSFLGAQLAIGAVAITLATGDPSTAIVEDYYQKALDFDKQRELELASSRLNWDTRVEFGDDMSVEGYRDVAIRLLDREGRPVVDLVGQLRLYHHARASEIQEIQLQSVGDGIYHGRVKMTRDGLWEVEMEFERGAGVGKFVYNKTLNLDLKTDQTDGTPS